MLSKEQAEEIKKQLLPQINKLPDENKEQIKEYIQGLNEEELEDFLKKQNIQFKTDAKQEGKSPCIFCSIVKNEIPSYKIAETKKEIAILEINPLTKGHSIVLPKEHASIEKIPKSALTLAQKIAKKIKKKLKPEDIKIETSSLQGHAMINIIPIYKDQKMEKRKADEKELKDIQKKLMAQKRQARGKKEKKPAITAKPQSNLPEIGFRIP